MPLLSKELKEAFTTKKVSSSTSNELYFNPGSVDAKKKARFTILGDDSLGGYQLFVNKKEGGMTCIRWASEPTEADVAPALRRRVAPSSLSANVPSSSSLWLSTTMTATTARMMTSPTPGFRSLPSPSAPSLTR